MIKDNLLSPQGRLTWAARWLAWKLAVLTPLVHLSLMLFGYQRTFAVLRRLANWHTRPAVKMDDLERFSRGLRRINRLVRDHSPLPGSCLSRSLALWLMLRSQGIDARLHIGCRREDGQFQAHAWVEWMERPVNAGVRVKARYVDFQYHFD